MMGTILLNRVHYPVTTLGPGSRIGLWMQGCHIGCPGCASRDTWAADPAKAMSVADVLSWCRRAAPAGPDGVTISGGEPFEQPEALLALLTGLHVWRQKLARPFDILCYSGMPLHKLKRDYQRLLSLLDVLIPEPFVESLQPGGRWRGSKNQPLVLLTRLARKRYLVGYSPKKDQNKHLQVEIENDRLVFIGIPQPGDLARLERRAVVRGVALKEVSWRP